MKRPLSPEQLGKRGEHQFERLCDDADWIANKSETDLMGWDYVVEVPYPISLANEALDKRRHPIESKIQVKTVWDHTDHISLTLSAAERLAKARLPSFIVVFTVDPTKTVTAMYAFHMLDRHLERILKRLRKATAEGSLKINHVEISFPLNSGVKLPPSGDALRDFMLKAVGDDADAYFREKQSQLANLGFGPLRYQGKFTVKAKSEEEISEMFLGLRSMEVTSFDAYEIRFGIKLLDSTSRSGTLSIRPKHMAECKIVAKRGSSTSSIPGKLYLTPHAFSTGGMPFRISTRFFEFIGSGLKATIDYEGKDLMTVLATTPELLAILKFNQVMAEGGGQLAVTVKGKALWQSHVGTPLDNEQQRFAKKRVHLAEIAARIFKAAGGRDQLITFGSLIDNADDLTFLADLLTDETTSSIKPMVFTPTDGVLLPPISEALLIKKARFPNFSVAYYTVVAVTLTSRPTDMLVEFGSISLRDISILDDNDESLEAYIDEARGTTGIAMTIVCQELTKIADQVAD